MRGSNATSLQTSRMRKTLSLTTLHLHQYPHLASAGYVPRLCPPTPSLARTAVLRHRHTFPSRHRRADQPPPQTTITITSAITSTLKLLRSHRCHQMTKTPSTRSGVGPTTSYHTSPFHLAMKPTKRHSVVVNVEVRAQTAYPFTVSSPTSLSLATVTQSQVTETSPTSHVECPVPDRQIPCARKVDHDRDRARNQPQKS